MGFCWGGGGVNCVNKTVKGYSLSPRLGPAESDKLKDEVRRPDPPSSSSEVLNLTLTL